MIILICCIHEYGNLQTVNLIKSNLKTQVYLKEKCALGMNIYSDIAHVFQTCTFIYFHVEIKCTQKTGNDRIPIKCIPMYYSYVYKETDSVFFYIFYTSEDKLEPQISRLHTPNSMKLSDVSFYL